MATSSLAFDDWLACLNLSHRWAQIYDTKKLDDLSTICTPTLKLDYSGLPAPPALTGAAVPVQTLIDCMRPVLGHKDLATLHQLSNAVISSAGEGKAEGKWYVMGRHHLNDLEANGYGTITFWYERVDGVWKLAGLRPDKPSWFRGDIKGLMQSLH